MRLSKKQIRPLVLLSLLGVLCTGAQAQAPVSQQRINELAASLLRFHRAVIEEPGLRRENEPLGAYMARLAAPLPAEPPARYHARMENYLSALYKTRQAAQAFGQIAPLHDGSPPNRKRWQEITQAIANLPVREKKVRSAWQRAQSTGVSAPLGIELEETLQHVKLAYDALRDARP